MKQKDYTIVEATRGEAGCPGYLCCCRQEQIKARLSGLDFESVLMQLCLVVGSCLCGLFWVVSGWKETDADKTVSVKKQNERNNGQK
jgi:uncharacterized membrane protein YciS (DUF1049 family)